MKRLAFVLVVAAGAMQAFADSGAADRAVEEAKSRAASNDFVGAAGKYREAYKADPRPDLMCNVGVAYYKAQDLPRAHRYLEQCLSIGSSLDRAFIDNVKKVLAAVDTRLANGSFTPVDLLVEPPSATITVEGGTVFDEPILGSRRVWFPFGSYRLVVHAEGHVDKVLEISAKDRTQVPARVALVTAPPVETAPVQPEPPHEQGSAAGSAQEIHAPAPVVAPQRRNVLPPVVATTVSVGLGAVALGYFIAARDSASNAGATTDRPEYDKLKEEAQNRQHMSWLFGGIAGAGAVISGVLWYRYTNAPRIGPADRSESGRLQFGVQATGSGAGVSLSGRW